MSFLPNKILLWNLVYHPPHNFVGSSPKIATVLSQTRLAQESALAFYSVAAMIRGDPEKQLIKIEMFDNFKELASIS